MDGMGDSGGSGVTGGVTGGANGGVNGDCEMGLEGQFISERKKKQWGPPTSIDPVKSSKMTYAKEC